MFNNNKHFEVQTKPNKKQMKNFWGKLININDTLNNTKINVEILCVHGQEDSVS